MPLDDPWRLVRGHQPQPSSLCTCRAHGSSPGSDIGVCGKCGLPLKHLAFAASKNAYSLPSDQPAGQHTLAGAFRKPVSFRISHRPVQPVVPPEWALSEWLYHQSVGDDVLGIKLMLVFEVLVLLFASYLGNNAVKLFAHMTRSREQTLRQQLGVIAGRHYSEAITALRMHISTLSQYDVAVALKALALLNKCSIYEFANLFHLIIFGQGMLLIFCDALERLDAVDALVRNTLGYINMVSRLAYYPSYTPDVLVEFQGYLRRYSQFVTNKDISSDWIVQHFDQIWYYVKDVIDITAHRDIEEIRLDSNLIYKLLRRWMLMLPPKLHIMTSLAHPMERVLMLLYKTLTSILNNVFPTAMFMYLLGFNGGLTLWYDTHHTLPRETDLTCNILQSIERYCFRVNSFFKIRHNHLVVAFGAMPLDGGVSATAMRRQLNEVMIRNFTNSLIRLYNFLHLPLRMRPTLSVDTLKNLNNIGNLYDYNKEHFDNLKAEMAATCKGVHMSDPLLRFHVANTSDYKIQGDESAKFDYKLWLSDDETEHHLVHLNQEYSELFKKGFPVPRDTTTLDPRTGLYMDDSEPFLMITEQALQTVLANVNPAGQQPDVIRQIVPATMDMRKHMLANASDDSSSASFYDVTSEKFYQAEENYSRDGGSFLTGKQQRSRAQGLGVFKN